MVSEHNRAFYYIVKHWEGIIGAKYAQMAWPLKITNPNRESQTSLIIAINNPSMALFIQANEQRLIERIAQIIGFKAIKKIKTKLTFETNTAHVTQNAYIEEFIPENIDKSKALAIKQSIANIDSTALKPVLEDLASSLFNEDD